MINENIKAILVIAATVASFLFGWFANGWRLESKMQQEQIEAERTASKMLSDNTDQMIKVASGYVSETENRKSKNENLKKEMKDAQKKYPDNSISNVDAEQLRVLKEAVAIANNSEVGH